jgi:hypothetical protein
MNTRLTGARQGTRSLIPRLSILVGETCRRFWRLTSAWPNPIRRRPAGAIREQGYRAPPFFNFGTFSHFLLFADLSTASQMYCVSSASRKVGEAGLPESMLEMKSAT